MDERIRRLEQEIIRGDSWKVDQLIHAFIQSEDIDGLFETLGRIRERVGPPATIEDSFLVKLTRAMCRSDDVWELLNHRITDALLTIAGKTGVWHGIKALTDEEIKIWNEELRHKFFYQKRPERPGLRLERDWVTQERILCTYFIIFRQKTPTQLVGWGMNGAGFEHIVLQPLMRLLHNCQHSSFCSKSFLWKGIDPN